VKEAVAYITEIACNYEALVKQSKEKYGSSMAEQMSKRKKKQNMRKEKSKIK
jgi:hypothetical protein